jgi:hypothetical protein
MTPAQTIHSILPVFNWSWWQVFIFVFITDWVIMRILKYIEPSEYKSPTWASAKYGDLFLPIGIASSIVVLRGFHNANAWYASIWWNWTVLVMGILINFSLRTVILYKILHKHNRKQHLAPSKWWHSFIFAVLFYLVVMSLIPLFVIHAPRWAFTLALFGYGIWIATFMYDVAHPSGFVRRKTKTA